MALIVQKFGGTSVADTTKILAAARKAIRETRAGNRVVMVVSAMGKQTDRLIDLAKEISPRPAARDLRLVRDSRARLDRLAPRAQNPRRAEVEQNPRRSSQRERRRRFFELRNGHLGSFRRFG